MTTENLTTENPGTRPMQAAGVTPEVSAYLGLVRAALADLPPEDLEDLTGGLEADLTELASESEEPLLSRLGEPSAYAAELRSSAGFPPPEPTAAPPQAGWGVRVRESWSTWWTKVRDDHPWIEKLRPVWWLLRGAVLITVAFWILGVGTHLVLMLLGAAISFSVGLAQDTWAGWRTRLVRIANVVAALLLLPVLAEVGAAGSMVYAQPSYIEVAPSTGIYVNGDEVVNLFVYDGTGQQVDGARIFTDLGMPLNIEPWMIPDWDSTVGQESPFEIFPITAGDLAGWTVNPGEGWIPPVAIPPAFPIEPGSAEPRSEPTDAETGAAVDGDPEATSGPTDDEALAEEPASDPSTTATP